MASPTVLIAVVNRPQDLETILTKKWYRIPVIRLPARNFDYIAFYQTTATGISKGHIAHFARIAARRVVTRRRLLPHEPDHPRAHDQYVQFTFRRIRTLAKPIVNSPGMRVNFGFASLNKLIKARTLANLYGIRQVELVFRKLLTKHRIPFAAELPIRANGRTRYRLDFAIFCRKGKINVECDMKRFHAGTRRINDARRDRFMKRRGWEILRFTDEALLRDPHGCLKMLRSKIRSLGGIGRGEFIGE